MTAPLLDVDLEALVDIDLVCEITECDQPAVWAVQIVRNCGCPTRTVLMCDRCLIRSKALASEVTASGRVYDCTACGRTFVPVIQVIVLMNLKARGA